MVISKMEILSSAVLILILLSFTACETMNGAGKDIEHAGDAVQDAAQ